MQKKNLDSLNKNQKEAVLAPLKPTLVLAGAGSGKTKVITHRINHLLLEGFAPHEIVAVTFTNKAIKEIQERVFALPDQNLNKKNTPLICTFHNLCVHILRKSISHLKLGFFPNFSLATQKYSSQFLKYSAKKNNISFKEMEDFSNYICDKKRKLLTPSDIFENEENSKFLKGYDLYQKQLRECNALDFDDLLFFTVKLFDKFPEVASEYSNTWKALFIDEYQDVNELQYRIAKSLVQSHQNIFVVGDPDQSIYSWIGANMEHILSFEKDFPNATIIKLEKNYRSQSNILDVANALIKNNSNRLEKHLQSVKGPGEKAKLFIGVDEKHEATFIANHINDLHLKRGIPLKDMCVLFRTNLQSRILEKSFLDHHIPYDIIDENSFYEKKEIEDVLAYLKMLVSKRDFFSFERTINTPSRSLGPKTIKILTNYARKFSGSILEACQDILVSPKTKLEKKLNKKQINGLQEYCSILSSLKELVSKVNLNELVEKTITLTKYEDHLKNNEEKENNLKLLKRFIRNREDQNYQPNYLQKYLDEVALQSSFIKNSSYKKDQVSLMTIHNSKGLEFPVVFISGLEDDLLPHIKSNKPQEIEEERRLFYVAITRAKDRLYLSRAKQRSYWDKEEEEEEEFKNESPFLKEICQYCEQVYI